ncbi:binding--dependent transport system inner membrane component family protein [Paraburkholderia xenovorans LB400]|uniref:ABC spermidine/putrescine transporter, inner membrane subunit n=1 Tax=Paraburkholderia xenovorans (strain LB400) TaxID=266265 RepID=Q13FP2_PARXL|nr:ABC transporter permease [Paraburkholderia xenovorans]ABE37097.1 ABC spermidine/putrescine transporter, inner membrane subunit [Paraburkholderia xenovorans LB400]AIP34520.1 binding--dependent transport system inner membrane component family protein [Paraburkholderia xenovorans LB400]
MTGQLHSCVDARRLAHGVPRVRSGALTGPLLVLPAAAFLMLVFVLPTVLMVAHSVTRHLDAGTLVRGVTAENYARLLRSALYRNVLWRTLKIATLSSVIAVPIAYPLALVIAQGRPLAARLTLLVVLSPLLVLVVIRAYGWKLILARGGFLTELLQWLHLSPHPRPLLYTDWAVVIASVHVFLPLMVLPLAGAIRKIQPSIAEAAQTLGADARVLFQRIVVPMSMPGLTVGITLVFSLTATSYVTPQILGGNFSAMLGNLVQQQVLTLNDWPFGAAIASLMLAMALLANLLFIVFVERHALRWTRRQR